MKAEPALQPAPGRETQADAPAFRRQVWHTPAGATAAGLGLWCCGCVDAGGDADAETCIASQRLHPLEWTAWRSLPGTPSRRRRWLRGRVAAQDAVCLLLMHRDRRAVAPRDIRVTADRHGAPQVTGGWLTEGCAPVAVSLSHGRGVSLAVATTQATSECPGVGVDLALLDEDHDGLAEGGFAPNEVAGLAGLPAPLRAEWLLRFWCSKEATGKALGRGLLGSPLNLRIVGTSPEGDEVQVALQGPLARLFPTVGTQTCSVSRSRGAVLAVCRLTREIHHALDRT